MDGGRIGDRRGGRGRRCPRVALLPALALAGCVSLPPFAELTVLQARGVCMHARGRALRRVDAP